MARSAAPLALVSVLAGLACKRAPEAAPAASTPPPAGVAPVATAPPDAGVLFPTGVMLHGDRASLQHYLRYVDTVADAQVKLTYAPRTVVIGRNAAIRSLHSASWDGVTWRFDAEEPAVRRIEVGSVVLVWGLAIRKVNTVERVGDEIVLTTQEAQLTDAVTDAKITWDAPPHLLQGAMTIRVPSPKDSVRFIRSGFTAPRQRHPSPFRLASFPMPVQDTTPADSTAPDPPTLYSESFKLKVGEFGVAMAFGAAGEDALNFYAQFAWGQDAEEPVGLPGEYDPVFKKGGEFADWVHKQQEARDKEAEAGKKKAKQVADETKITSGTGPGVHAPIPKNSNEQQAQKEEEDAEAEYEKKYGAPSRSSTDIKPKLPAMPKVPSSFADGAKSVWSGLTALTAVKVTAAGTVTGFRSKGDISITGGVLDRAQLENPAFHMIGDIFWAIRLNEAVLGKHTHVEVPVAFRVPVIVGGLPFFLEVGVNAQIQPALTSRNATASGHRHIDFAKGAALIITPGGVSGEAGEPAVEAQKGPEEKITGIGVSGLMIALQVPRIALGFGIIGSNITGYFDVVIASGSTFTGTTGIIQCSHEQLTANFNVGLSASFLGISLYKDERKAGPSKNFDWYNPEGHKCG